jgi:hypothetical protein
MGRTLQSARSSPPAPVRPLLSARSCPPAPVRRSCPPLLPTATAHRNRRSQTPLCHLDRSERSRETCCFCARRTPNDQRRPSRLTPRRRPFYPEPRDQSPPTRRLVLLSLSVGAWVEQQRLDSTHPPPNGWVSFCHRTLPNASAAGQRSGRTAEIARRIIYE